MPRSSQNQRHRRVAFFDDHPHVDAGATRWTRTVASELHRRGWQVTIIFPHDGIAVQRARAEGIEVLVLPTPRGLQRYGQRPGVLDAVFAIAAIPAYWFRLSRRLKSGADVVHANDHRGLVLAGPAARLARRRLVWHVHGANTAPAVLNWLGSGLADAVVVPSTAARDACPGLTADVAVLPNAVADRWFEGAIASPVEPRVIITVGRLHPIKGIDVLLRSAALLRQQRISFRLLVVGGEQIGHTDYAEDLRGLTTQLELDAVVEFVGAVDDPLPLVRGASVYVQPSRFEFGGLALLEAMATGTPVVATAVGGMRELVTDGETGWLVPPEDPSSLADALRQALTSKDASRVGAAGHNRARAFTVGALVDRLERLYETVLAR